MIDLAVLLTLLLATAGNECVQLQAAHEKLLQSSFTAERTLAVVFNGELKARETARLNYRDRKLEVEVVEKETLDKNIVLEEGDTDPALELRFSCERMENLEDGRYRLRSAEGIEELEMIFDAERGVLVPAVFRSTEKERFLWKKFIIEVEVIYRHFAWE